MQFRIGINLGDLIVDEDDIFGDGVNVAARLEMLAEPGGICVSAAVRDQVGDRLDQIAFEDIGEQSLKNIARPLRVFRIRLVEPGAMAAPEGAKGAARTRKPSIAMLPLANMSGDPASARTASPKTSSPSCRAFTTCSSSPATRPSPIRAGR